MTMTITPTAALVPYVADTAVERATAWADMPDEERRRRAVQACQDHDAHALWQIAENYLTLHGRRGATVSPYTRRNYRQGIERLVSDWAHENLLHPGRHAAASWVRHLEAAGKRDKEGNPAGMASATVQVYVAAARLFYVALRDAGATTDDPFKDVRPAADRTPADQKRRPYGEDDVRALLRAAQGTDRILVLLGAHAGLRVGEMLALRWSDINLAEGNLTVQKGKGGKRRDVPLSHSLRDALQQVPVHLRVGSVLGYGSAFSARWHLHRLAEQAGVTYRGAHALRHSAGTRLARQTGNLQDVAGLLGHASIEMAAVYAKWSNDDLRQAVEQW